MKLVPQTSRETSLSKRKHTKPSAIYTVGYQGKTPEEFIALLLEHGVEQLLDVRRDPISRKPGFSKRRLEEACESVGMVYVHIPELGIASDLRKNATTPKGHAQLLKTYATKQLHVEFMFVQQTAEYVREKVSALMCFESDVACCHRGPLAEAVSRLTELPIRHL